MQIQVIYFDANVVHNCSQTNSCLSKKIQRVCFGGPGFMPNQFKVVRYLEKLFVIACISSLYDSPMHRFPV